jgi:valyl-tRNA synthetase
MDKKYDHNLVEAGRYDKWLQANAFQSGDRSKQPFTIVIPPPNVTGKLHLGHAWDSTIQDIIIRRKRMMGFDALWLPGMDHAGIATQAKVDERLKSQGVSRYDLGREKFLDAAWAWKSEYATSIRAQWAKLGLSLDYSKERFTLDEGLNHAVNEVFITLFNKGLIYRGERIIQWDPEAKTALSNIEVDYLDVQGALYQFTYPLEDGTGGITIATTRPETMFGDTALMVHPKDKRYAAYVGKRVYIPGTETLIPVITDEYVDMAFGTGAVKVTPAHDPNDFLIGTKYNLPMPLCMNEDGTMNELAFQYNGMDRFACRKQLVKDLQAKGLCPHIEPITHAVGHSERTGAPVEPRLSKQWFVKMEPLSRSRNQATTNGPRYVCPGPL